MPPSNIGFTRPQWSEPDSVPFLQGWEKCKRLEKNIVKPLVLLSAFARGIARYFWGIKEGLNCLGKCVSSNRRI